MTLASHWRAAGQRLRTPREAGRVEHPNIIVKAVTSVTSKQPSLRTATPSASATVEAYRRAGRGERWNEQPEQCPFQYHLGVFHRTLL